MQDRHLFQGLPGAHCTRKRQSMYAKAIAYHQQELAIAKEVGDRAGEGKAYGNLGNAHMSQGG